MWYIKRGLSLNLDQAIQVSCDNNSEVKATMANGKIYVLYTGKDWDRFLLWLNGRLGSGGVTNETDYTPKREGYR
jgi:hypothetical protein